MSESVTVSSTLATNVKVNEDDLFRVPVDENRPAHQRAYLTSRLYADRNTVSGEIVFGWE